MDSYLAVARFFGIHQLIVAVHQMDKVNFSDKTYEEVKKYLRSKLEGFGWDTEMIPFIPTAVQAEKDLGQNINKPDCYTASVDSALISCRRNWPITSETTSSGY